MSEQPFGTEDEPAGTSPGTEYATETAAPVEQPDPTPAPSSISDSAQPSTESPAPAGPTLAEQAHAIIPTNHPAWLHDLVDVLLRIITEGPAGN